MSRVYTAVVEAEKIPEKSFCTFEINGMDIVICRFQDEYFAVENRCTHANSTFDGGRMRGCRIMCPLHGATFDIRDGSTSGRPAKFPLNTYPCRVKDGMVEVALEAAE